MRILAVDDNRESLRVLEAILIHHGHEVVGARNGVEAMDRLCQSSFDAIVSDILMPEMDGFQLCLEVKTDPRLKQIPFIIYTVTYTSREDEELASVLGVDAYLRKPMDHKSFVSAIEETVSAVSRGVLAPRRDCAKSLEAYQLYSQRLVHKLNKKINDLEREIRTREDAEKTLKEQHNQLIRAQKMEAVATLAGGIAHDFNNLLTVIMGNAELAMQEVSEEADSHAAIEQIVRAARRAEALVRQILTFSRHVEQEKNAVSIAPIVDETVKFLRSSLPSTIEIDVDVPTSCPKIMADPTQIQQVLMNLCTNANHAMKQKGGQLTIRVEEIAIAEENGKGKPDIIPGTYVRLTVSDTGHGMPPEILDRIFEPYFTSKAPGEGTGLGLSVVHGIVTKHAGMMRVASDPGKGSTFEVFFPVVAREWDSAEPAPRNRPRGHERVLLVDDDEMVALLGQRLFQSLGYTVTTHMSSTEALEVFREDPGRFDVVVTDMTMPKMTGRELALEIMAICPHMPVILCTGYSDQITEEEAKAIGIREFVMKPLSLDKVAYAVRRVLDTR
ncbi:MAG: response regulator [Thermodesulfobacteriota bacterium]